MSRSTELIALVPSVILSDVAASLREEATESKNPMPVCARISLTRGSLIGSCRKLLDAFVAMGRYAESFDYVFVRTANEISAQDDYLERLRP